MIILDQLRQYQMIGTIEEFRVAIEKQIPKKPRKTDSYRGLINKIYAYVCPTCGNACLERWMNERQETMYCWNCGQRLQW